MDFSCNGGRGEEEDDVFIGFGRGGAAAVVWFGGGAVEEGLGGWRACVGAVHFRCDTRCDFEDLIEETVASR